ncbi:hypothetical protein AB6870_12410 [Rahnella inusitata]|uniref:hypothetical protein n=1 Tax=Rahnella inusitata TaxID=58169 RepID=UPI0039BDADFF
MKYEITKGSEKDFEGAPEWARFRTSSYFFEGFSEGLRWGYIPSGCNFVSNHGVWRNAESPFQHHINNVIAERRPITEPVWDGEDLPPVGSTFDMRLKPNGLWLETKLIAAGQEQIIYFREGMEFAGHKNNYEFRPIRSPEDVAKDEAIESMAEIIEYRTGCSPKPLARWLYEAGYRKME